ncbi:DUF2796 domain-containing protein [Vibrio tapetis subsp. quintayensis]|uniref:zinc uptake protein ZrgA n=1 Tax=Vibrio tapetis TaxID=52443 RepID=UPI0025B3839A|nr:DUF2796 domain-containing protein [Vibrio tapetis]MDN3680001.1 DUF2796 domain-containing protein [Vibrio tapetis subsp. quintayensis]
MNRTFSLTLLSTAILSGSAFADESFRQHDAHVHGVVEFNMAQEDNVLMVEISAPGADVVGFEHAPKTDEQKATLTQAELLLMQPNNIFMLPDAASCKVVHAHVSNTLENSKPSTDHEKSEDHAHAEHKHEEHHDHDHDEHKHEEHHDHDHAEHKHEEHHDHDHAEHKHEEHHDHDHDEHKQEEHHDHDHDEHKHEEHHDHEHGGHGEFVIEYQFQCDNIDALKQVDTKWFTHFPSTEKVHVNLITDEKQISTELSATNQKIEM